MTTHPTADRPVPADRLDPDSALPATDPTLPVVRDDITGMKTARTSGVVRAGAVMAVATVVSRATGFLAKVVILAFLGFGAVNDAYTIANTLPNIIFELLIGGVLTSVAIPLLSRARADPDGGEGYTQRLMTMAFVGLLAATALAVAAAPLLTRVYLAGDGGVVDRGLATGLALLLLPQIFFYGIAALFGAILNTKEKFGVPAWAPVANNLVVIAVGIILIATTTSDAQHVTEYGGALSGLTREQFLILGLGTTAGIVVQALVMVPSLVRGGFRFRWRWGGDRRLLEAGQLMLWAVVYVLISQAGYIVVTQVASANIVGGIGIYAFASLLFQLPYGIIGVSILTAIMPRMSRHAAAGQYEQMKDDASLGNRLSIVALLPVATGMIVLAASLAIVASLYGAVSLRDVQVLGSALVALALGLVPFAVTLMQMRVFYAMKDARTPALINLVMVGVRIPLLIACVQLSPELIVPGMALGTTVSYLVGAVVGEIWLRHRYGSMGTARTLVTLGKMTLASVSGGAAAIGVQVLAFDGPVDTSTEALGQILLCAPVGLLVIAVVALLLRVEELDPIRRRFLARLPGRARRKPAVDPNGTVNPAASTRVRNGGHGRLVGGAPSVASSASAGAVSAGGPSVPSSTSREQVSETVSDNRSGGPAVDNCATDDPEATTEVHRDELEPVTQPGGEPEPVTPDAESTRTITVGASDSAATVAMAGPAAAPQSQLKPGMMVGGRYRLVNLVASDGAGQWFWRAKDAVLPRDMAVTILADTTGTSATVARTLRAGKLHHVGLPQTLDVGTDHGQSYVVGQWVDGATLTDLVSGGPLDADVATSITAKLSEAVAEAHRNGVSLGAIHPSLVRVNFDGQVRLSHVIAHASATPDQDIRAIGGLLYLMLTGTWPLAAPGAEGDGSVPLPAAPTRLGREVPADEVVGTVPEALSALAERALHPDEPDGIHAVGAIAALLRSPENAPGTAEAPPPPEIRPLSAADRRLIRERRAKLSLAGVVLAVFAILIVIALGGLTNQFMASIQNSAPDELPMIDSAAATTAPATTEGAAETTATTTAGAAAAGPVKIVGGAVYDPEGDGTPDYKDYVDRAFDGNEGSFWLTWVYKQQFPTLKSGVGLTLELEKEVSPTQVTVKSATNETVIEVRTATSLTPGPVDSTTKLGWSIVKDGVATVDITGAPKSKYLIVYVVKLGQTPDNQFQSKINEIIVTGS